MENETPYWENLNINRKCCKFFSKFIGKNCDIGLKGYDIYIPPYSTLSGTTSIKGVLQDFLCRLPFLKVVLKYIFKKIHILRFRIRLVHLRVQSRENRIVTYLKHLVQSLVVVPADMECHFPHFAGIGDLDERHIFVWKQLGVVLCLKYKYKLGRLR